ncbi:hypothetical protein AAMO2058_001359900 [Amorphochlora amoebiformis]|mmetsp:Transcript_4965/g.7548  ORF Transcript_4965/g.7548 Transcript_4965/m.7548 type:complete len:226 (-) Transcript_4965:61-738(-)
METPLRVTERIKQAMGILERRIATLPSPSPEDSADIRRLLEMKNDNTITFENADKLSALFRKLKLSAEDHSGYLFELLEGSEISFPEEKEVENRNPAFLRKLEDLQLKQDRLLLFGPPKEKDSGMKSLTMELGLGVNILLLMGTSFFVLYWAGKTAFPDSDVIPVIMGAMGLIGILVIETILLIAREERVAMWNNKAAKKEKKKYQAPTSKEAPKQAPRRRRGFT